MNFAQMVGTAWVLISVGNNNLISANIIEHSVSSAGKEIITFVVEYHRFIHSELNTHRMFSRNASSSRAIPIDKIIARVNMDPALPVFWGKNQKGMQSYEELDPESKAQAMRIWLEARDNAVASVRQLQALGLHKQLSNRLLEPWMWIAVVLTSTEWGNWYSLRYEAQAQPEIQVLAKTMYKAQMASKPTLILPSQAHLPFLTTAEKLSTLSLEKKMQISAARASRVSYNNQYGIPPTIEEDENQFTRLMGGMPKHASPTEHQATPLEDPCERSGNLVGWLQFRKTIPGENSPIFKAPVGD